MAAPVQTLLGVCDGHIHRHRCSFLTNKVGGEPDWLLPSVPDTPRCARCGNPLAHVVQVYCPLEVSRYHRNLHVFACPVSECRSLSWKVLRFQRVETETHPPRGSARPESTVTKVTDWCEDAEQWEDGEVVKEQPEVQLQSPHTVAQMDVSSQLEQLRLGEPAVFTPFFISVVDESDLCGGGDDELQHACELLREYERREGAVSAGEPGGEEKYEKTRARHGDASFSRFMKSISACPQQILRYSRGGRPLYISQPPADMPQRVSACGSCGGRRTFELQLMPALVSLLQRTDGRAEAELEFGTVLVFTCEKSCWMTDTLSVEEFCFVQPDPDQQLFAGTNKQSE
ncbi:programmed cell death protein 2-like [Gouania willdenowi]|uniref:Programmed cell death protein 2 C-terminal domain-containing protein n=1 Tax=Gouania willdenowi TaxID=441366 RepID=A0A8C5EFX4_GOUWI|nr:programmed cell death protein 2-like [Gouania willdenowi]